VTGELILWFVIILLLAIAHWKFVRVDQYPSWDATSEEVLEAAQFSCYRNRLTESALPQISGDYDAQPFALDHDVRPTWEPSGMRVWKSHR
jgi:hypothetical protein